MDILSAFESYVAAVQSGSLSGAARQRKLSQPAISQQIASVEAHFGARMLRRGRSGVSMTEAGKTLYRHALIMLDELAALEEGLEAQSDRIAGRLVVTTNQGFSQHVMSDVIVDIKKAHPDLDIVLRADNRLLDLEAEGVDVALRTGSVGRGSGVVRKVGMMKMLLVASPEYLDLAGRPHSPDSLAQLDFIQFKSDRDQIATTLQRNGDTIQAPIKVGLTAQYPDLIEKAVHGNLGYAKLPEFLVTEYLQQGHLEEVLPHWDVPATELFVVFSDRQSRTSRLVVFLDVLLGRLERAKGIEILASTHSMRSR